MDTTEGWTAGEEAAKDPHDRADRPWWQGAVFYQIYPRSFLQGRPFEEWEPRRQRLFRESQRAFREKYPDRSFLDTDGLTRYIVQACRSVPRSTPASPLRGTDRSRSTCR